MKNPIVAPHPIIVELVEALGLDKATVTFFRLRELQKTMGRARVRGQYIGVGILCKVSDIPKFGVLRGDEI